MTALLAKSRTLLGSMTFSVSMDSSAASIVLGRAKPDLRQTVALLITMVSYLYPKDLIDLVIHEMVKIHGIEKFNVFTVIGRRPEYFNLDNLKNCIWAKVIECTALHNPLTEELLARLVDDFMSKYTHDGPMSPAEIKEVLEKADPSIWVSSLQIVPDCSSEDPFNFLLCLTASLLIDFHQPTWLISKAKSDSLQRIVDINDEVLKKIGITPFLEAGFLVKEGDQFRISTLTVALIIEAIRKACPEHTFITSAGKLININ